MKNGLAAVMLLERLIRDNAPSLGDAEVRLRMPDGSHVMVNMTARKDPLTSVSCILGEISTSHGDGIAVVLSNTTTFDNAMWIKIARVMLRELLAANPPSPEPDQVINSRISSEMN